MNAVTFEALNNNNMTILFTFLFISEFGKETSVGVSDLKSAQVLETIETLADKK